MYINQYDPWLDVSVAAVGIPCFGCSLIVGDRCMPSVNHEQLKMINSRPHAMTVMQNKGDVMHLHFTLQQGLRESKPASHSL